MLTPAQLVQLLAVLRCETESFKAIEEQFNAQFSPETHPKVVFAMRSLFDASVRCAVSLQTTQESLVGCFLLSILQCADKTAQKSALYEQLERLDIYLREDSWLAEQHKYKSSSTVAKKPLGKDVTSLDLQRSHLLQKLFIFRCITGKVDKSQTPRGLLQLDQAAIDSEIASWGAEKQVYADALGELKILHDHEIALCSVGGFASREVPTPQDFRLSNDKDLVPLSVSTVGVVPIRPIVGPSITAADLIPVAAAPIYQFDATSHAPEWSSARKLIANARTQNLEAAEHQQLVAFFSVDKKNVDILGITAEVFTDISRQNKDVATEIIRRSTNAGALLDALIALPNAEGCQRASVLLAAGKALTARHVNAYITANVQFINSQSAGQGQNALVKSFAVTLHQLRENNKSAVNGAELPKAVSVFARFTSIQDVTSLWGDHLPK